MAANLPSETIFVADDGGVSASIDDALIELNAIGVLDQCHAIVNYPDSPGLLKRLSEEVPALGLHINLSSGRPVTNTSNIGSLLAGQEFINPAKWVTEKHGPIAALEVLKENALAWRPSEISLEVRAQLECFFKFTKRAPSAVSVHHDLDVLPNVQRAIKSIIELPTRAEQIENSFLASCSYNFALTTETAQDWIDNISGQLEENMKHKGVHLFVCHPARSSKGYEDFSAYRRGRVVEYQALKEFAKRTVRTNE